MSFDRKDNHIGMLASRVLPELELGESSCKHLTFSSSPTKQRILDRKEWKRVKEV